MRDCHKMIECSVYFPAYCLRDTTGAGARGMRGSVCV
jgi:hypothetical protein